MTLSGWVIGIYIYRLVEWWGVYRITSFASPTHSPSFIFSDHRKMGNCQAVDNSSFVLQTQNGKAERFYSPISAAEITKLHPDHYVALLLTTTIYSSPPSSSAADHHHRPPNNNHTNTNQHLRVTRIKLLRPTDHLVLGHAYRLITTQDVMKGLNAKNNRKLNYYKNFQPPEFAGKTETTSICEAAATRSNQSGKSHHQMIKKADKHQPAPAISKSSGSKPRGWHPSLNSISETTS